jgi:hypothetical protein
MVTVSDAALPQSSPGEVTPISCDSHALTEEINAVDDRTMITSVSVGLVIPNPPPS